MLPCLNNKIWDKNTCENSLPPGRYIQKYHKLPSLLHVISVGYKPFGWNRKLTTGELPPVKPKHWQDLPRKVASPGWDFVWGGKKATSSAYYHFWMLPGG